MLRRKFSIEYNLTCKERRSPSTKSIGTFSPIRSFFFSDRGSDVCHQGHEIVWTDDSRTSKQFWESSYTCRSNAKYTSTRYRSSWRNSKSIHRERSDVTARSIGDWYDFRGDSKVHMTSYLVSSTIDQNVDIARICLSLYIYVNIVDIHLTWYPSYVKNFKTLNEFSSDTWRKVSFRGSWKKKSCSVCDRGWSEKRSIVYVKSNCARWLTDGLTCTMTWLDWLEWLNGWLIGLGLGLHMNLILRSRRGLEMDRTWIGNHLKKETFDFDFDSSAIW